jgi:hypothetical protein
MFTSREWPICVPMLCIPCYERAVGCHLGRASKPNPRAIGGVPRPNNTTKTAKSIRICDTYGYAYMCVCVYSNSRKSH